MPDLSSFPITQRWPASHPDRLQLYAAPTPNGVKVSIMLEETGLAYEPPPDRHLEQRVEGSGVRVAEPERTHTGDHRSGWP